MSNRWVLNASPLIVLARVGQAKLLNNLADEVVTPQAVAAEIEAGPADDPARQFLREGGTLTIVPSPSPSPELIAWDLGAGETAVLAYALANPGWTVVIDDASARKCARTFSIPVVGTLAVVLRAKQQGLIPSAAALLRQLKSNGFRLKDDLIREALQRTVGETWP
ncbi:MAG: DUF3368 domain-containing protein [Chloroflexi bacterium]|nr:DUF3368 domain-containing protein [Chloroflexota bacterium]MCI0644960.1 DUF3368 domain-containing protein [Chloroflexota bacterium]